MFEEKGTGECISGKIVNLDMFNHYLQDIAKIRARLETFIKEYRILHRLSNGPGKERLAQFIGIFSDMERMIVFTEYMAGRSVKDLLAEQALPEQVAYKYFYQACEGLNFLHNQRPPVIHRDIKAANLLITDHDTIKLANFGLVRDLAVDGFGIAVASEVTVDFRGTLLYVAPEVLTSQLGPGNRRAYGRPADVWALGCTFVEMLVRNPPHYEYFGKIEINYCSSELLQRARGPVEDQLPYLSKNLIPTASKNIRFLIDKIFEKQPELRPTVTHLVNVMAAAERSRNVSISNLYEEARPSTSQQNEEDGEEAQEKSEIQRNPSSRRKRPVLQKTANFESIDGIDGCTEAIPLTSIKDDKEADEKEERTFKLSSNLRELLSYNWFKAFYFSTILCKSVCYVLAFLVLGIGALLVFFFTALGIVTTARAVVHHFCECDLSSPKYILISGIFFILLFALFFSCCLIALGEYKFRMANRDIRKSRFFVPRPSKDIELFGVKVVKSKKDQKTEQKDEEINEKEMQNFYDAPQVDRNFGDLYDEKEEVNESEI
uniref:Protein kinase domain-containing protein n=1 Tax=Steinernema glaseri TaxID=37863 RepID=A0A1I7YRF1_9BILA